MARPVIRAVSRQATSRDPAVARLAGELTATFARMDATIDAGVAAAATRRWDTPWVPQLDTRISLELDQRIRRYQQKHALPSFAAATRQLIQQGLAGDGE